jgi:hypothetical protein
MDNDRILVCSRLSRSRMMKQGKARHRDLRAFPQELDHNAVLCDDEGDDDAADGVALFFLIFCTACGFWIFRANLLCPAGVPFWFKFVNEILEKQCALSRKGRPPTARKRARTAATFQTIQRRWKEKTRDYIILAPSQAWNRQGARDLTT